MKVLLRNGQTEYKDIYIKKENKIFSMCFMDVGDLFWYINKSELSSTKETFDIPATEREIYKLFDDLYQNISTANIFNNANNKYLERKLTETNLFNKNTNTIEWHSDATDFKSADFVKIIKTKDNYQLEFKTPEESKDTFRRGSSKIIAIRFRNSRSYYEPFNIAFMRMFQSAQNLKEIDCIERT